MKKIKNLSPLKAIKEYCKEQCCAGDIVNWKECEVELCPLKNYRFGKKSNAEFKDNNNIPKNKDSVKKDVFIYKETSKNDVLQGGMRSIIQDTEEKEANLI
jgi:hypothetical protein